MEFKAEEILLENEKSSLRKLLGVNISQVYCPWLQVDSSRITAMSFSISSKEHWFNITNKWLESPNDTTYHSLEIERSDLPKDIKYVKEERSVYAPVSSIVIATNQSRLKRIEVYSMHEQLEEGEDILYDYGLLFYFENNYRFSINVYEESIGDELELLREEEEIKKRYRDTKLRLIIE